MFKMDNSSPKVFPIDRTEYTELKIANKNFYEIIKNQKERIKMLEQNANKDTKNKVLFVEDSYIEIYKLAWLRINNYSTTIEKLNADFDKYADFSIFSKSNKDKLKNMLSNEYMDDYMDKKVVGLILMMVTQLLKQC